MQRPQPIPISEKWLGCLKAFGPETPSMSAMEKATQAWGAEAVRWAMTQIELRKRAGRRFPWAQEWLWDATGLDMATHPVVASYHASLFESDELVLDLTAGLGSDLHALLARGPARGVEQDPDRAALAAHNVGEFVEVGDAASLAQDFPAASFFADPARRHEGRRATDWEEWEPAIPSLIKWAAGRPRAVIKLGPGVPLDTVETWGIPRTEVVSYAGECRETLLLLGDGWEPGVFAVLLGEGPVLTLPAGETPPTSRAKTWIGELDPAARRVFAEPDGRLPMIGSTPSLRTSDKPLQSPWWRQTFHKVDEMPFDRKLLRRKLAELGVRLDAVKQGTGLPLDPAEIERDLNRRLVGPRSLVLLLVSYPEGVSAILAERTTGPS